MHAYRTHAHQVSCVASTSSDATLLAASKDNTLALWDFRTLTTTRVLRAPGFTVRPGPGAMVAG